MEISTYWLETILKRNQEQKAVCKVINFKEEAVVEKGDNYASDLSRIKMKVILGSGEVGEKSVIWKKAPSTELRAKAIEEWGIFRNEILIYSAVIPQMENLLAELEGEETIWGQCIYYHCHNQIILEDLKTLGYRMGDRRAGLDFEHVSLAVQSLAKYHALSGILNSRGILQTGLFSKSIYIVNDVEIFEGYINQTFNNLISSIDQFWEPEWQPYKEKIQKYFGKQPEIIKEICAATEKKYLFLNHGDCWTNNMMFKYSKDGKPTSLKFIDFQAPFYSSCAYDLAYFLATSPRPDVFSEKLIEILTLYQDSLQKTFHRFPNDVPPDLPTVQEIQTELERFAFFALTVATVVLPVMLVDPSEVPELEEWYKEAERGNSSLQFNFNVYRSKTFISKLKILLEWCTKQHVFD